MRRIFGGFSFPLGHGVRGFAGTSTRVGGGGSLFATLVVVLLALYLGFKFDAGVGWLVLGSYVLLSILGAAANAWRRP